MMSEENMDISGYSENEIKIAEDGLEIDFSRAKLLNTTGSICDAYEYRQGTRRVFVKKLKAEFKNSPRHRAALEKEYEIGASLSHPSLSTYRYAKNDYIVMDFVDGKTLSSMIQCNDPWLESGENALKILRELTSVIGYLHDRNLVHSDIKADNVIITNGTHNAILVDFDKCHSSSLDMVSGSPCLYGVKEDDIGSPQIDFNGLARIAEKLSGVANASTYRNLLRSFSRCCRTPGVSPDKLLKCLQHNVGFKAKTVWFSLAVLIALGGVAAIFFFTIHSNQSETDGANATATLDGNADSLPSSDVKNPVTVEPVESGGESPNPINATKEETVDLTSIKQELEQIYSPLYGQIAMTLAYIQEQGGADVLYGEEAMQLIENINSLQQEVWNKGFSLYQSHFPQLDYKEAYEGYSALPAFRKMVHSVDTVNALLVPVVKEKAPELRNRSFNYDKVE